MTISFGALSPLAAMFMGPINTGMDDPGTMPSDWRRSPPPELEIGLVQAAKIAGILFVPMGVVAVIFGVYLQGFRSDLMLDFQKVVIAAIDKHVEAERISYATLSEAAFLRTEIQRLHDKNDSIERQVRINTDLLQRISQKTGVR
jgi:hypothetical protein